MSRFPFQFPFFLFEYNLYYCTIRGCNQKEIIITVIVLHRRNTCCIFTCNNKTCVTPSFHWTVKLITHQFPTFFNRNSYLFCCNSLTFWGTKSAITHLHTRTFVLLYNIHFYWSCTTNPLFNEAIAYPVL